MPKPLAERRLKDRPGPYAVVEKQRIRSTHGTLFYAERQAKRVLAARQLDPDGCHLEVWNPNRTPESMYFAHIRDCGVKKLWSSEDGA